MDKNAIKKYAVWARRELISRVSQRAALYEITDKGYEDASADSVLGRVMSAEEKRQRQALIAQIREKGYEQVMEEIAYTWFNRFIALRFMEVNGYLPSRVRVFTDDENNFKPQILDEAINMELDGLDMEKVYALKNANDDDALFKYMIIVQCNALSSILPGMFQRISDYSELLFPDNLLREGSVIEQMVSMIPAEDWTDQVQIIGWLYQYYNTEPKDKVFADLKKNIKISKENIPAATQLFTPDWIVRYMVENSLGRLWLEGHPNDELKASWKYYLDEAEQEPDVQAQLAEIRKEYAALKPEDILAIDPCQGSGHILAYMFDVLVQIYESYGYTAREATSSIVEHNIWGLDIDDRAAQLAYFSVMMKARQYDRRFFSRGIQPHVYAIQESTGIDQHCIEYFADGKPELLSSTETLLKELRNAKEYGSIINVTNVDFSLLYARCEQIRQETTPTVYSFHVLESLLPLFRAAEAMAQKYTVVVTNPPYMGAANMSPTLSEFCKTQYPNTKSDLSTVFMDRAINMCSEDGLVSMINIPVWMFLSSFENMRKHLVHTSTFRSMLHFGRGVFGADFGTVSFVIQKKKIENYECVYRRLYKKQGAVDSVEQKQAWFFDGTGRFVADQDNFMVIPGVPIAYWLGETARKAFKTGISIDAISDFTGSQHKTADNDRFLRYWWGLNDKDIRCKDWIFYIKGGEYRKWYGNIELVVDWRDSARDYYISNPTSNMIKEAYWFKEGITYTSLTSSVNGFRYLPPIGVFDIKGPSLINVQHLNYCLGFFNSSVAMMYLKLLNPTITLQVKDVKNTPIIYDAERECEISSMVQENISASKDDWDSFETSWDFERHPLIRHLSRISDAFSQWERECTDRFNTLKENEEKLNQAFIEIYELQEEMDAAVEDSFITVRKANLERDVKSLISFAVGCMFGRYSLDKTGLIYAGGEWDASNYQAFIPDNDGVLPICDDEYFSDDIVGRFVEFIKVVYGVDALEENLSFIASVLGGKGASREVIRNYFINEFYADHLKAYQKRPIYWLFDSGKKNGFKCLIYMHRYQPDTIARIRTDYVHEQQSRYRTAIADLESRIANAGTGERVKLSKQLTKLQEQAEELRVYEEKIHHLADQMIRIDLDDGVKHNYAIFQDVLAKIK